ncbi:MAG TPA: hypothetical protein C5S37_03935 [Methanophagales archaeon]|nr:hypothetical protein [Methanophagales archaeon]
MVNAMTAEEKNLDAIRKRIDEIDDTIADLLIRRMQYAKQAKKAKMQMNKPVVDRQREEEVIEKWRERARKSRGSEGVLELGEEMMQKMAALLIEYTVEKEQEQEE